MDKLKKALENLEQFDNDTVVHGLFKKVLQEIKCDKKSKWQYIISGIFSILISALVVCGSKTIKNSIAIVEIFNTVVLAFMAMIFTSYAIFQALLTDSLIEYLACDKSNILKTCNNTFLNLLILYLSDTVLNTIVRIVLLNFSSDFLLIGDVLFSNTIALVLFLPYTFFNMLIILEMKNFIINMHKLFNASNKVRIYEYLNKELDKQDKNK